MEMAPGKMLRHLHSRWAVYRLRGHIRIRMRIPSTQPHIPRRMGLKYTSQDPTASLMMYSVTCHHVVLLGGILFFSLVYCEASLERGSSSMALASVASDVLLLDLTPSALASGRQEQKDSHPASAPLSIPPKSPLSLSSAAPTSSLREELSGLAIPLPETLPEMSMTPIEVSGEAPVSFIPRLRTTAGFSLSEPSPLTESSVSSSPRLDARPIADRHVEPPPPQARLEAPVFDVSFLASSENEGLDPSITVSRSFRDFFLDEDDDPPCFILSGISCPPTPLLARARLP
mmetsp:Transcript_2664/g.9126  ORF Transcript_2664/g.9126 Transcript_2664/m.9126 type:complete len:288 (+) Transcript_2664:1385-2248(+)